MRNSLKKEKPYQCGLAVDCIENNSPAAKLGGELLEDQRSVSKLAGKLKSLAEVAGNIAMLSTSQQQNCAEELGPSSLCERHQSVFSAGSCCPLRRAAAELTASRIAQLEEAFLREPLENLRSVVTLTLQALALAMH